MRTLLVTRTKSVYELFLTTNAMSVIYYIPCSSSIQFTSSPSPAISHGRISVSPTARIQTRISWTNIRPSSPPSQKSENNNNSIEMAKFPLKGFL